MPVIVMAAFLDSGRLNAETPFEITSTPVTAAHPAAKARRIRNTVRPSSAGDGLPAFATTVWCPSPQKTCTAPAPNMRSSVPMAIYVGMAKIRPDSRVPRRLMIMIRRIAKSPSATRYGNRAGKAEVSAAIPAAALTATVST